MTRTATSIAGALAAAALLLSSQALADPPWAGGPGKGGKQEMKGGKGKGKGQAGDCKYEYKYGPGGYKEEWKCGGQGRFQPGPPPWAPAHGYRRKQGGGGYAFPTGLLGGRCRADLLDGPTVGGLVGAAAGGFAGAQFGKGKGQLAATALGTLVGFVIGQQVGQSLGRTEETCFSRTFEHVPDRETIVWNEPERSAQYQVMPVRTAEANNGMYCREYQAKATVGGKVSETYGTACRMPDGSWKLMN
jgi:surface antigen